MSGLGGLISKLINSQNENKYGNTVIGLNSDYDLTINSTLYLPSINQGLFLKTGANGVIYGSCVAPGGVGNDLILGNSVSGETGNMWILNGNIDGEIIPATLGVNGNVTIGNTESNISGKLVIVDGDNEILIENGNLFIPSIYVNPIINGKLVYCDEYGRFSTVSSNVQTGPLEILSVDDAEYMLDGNTSQIIPLVENNGEIIPHIDGVLMPRVDGNITTFTPQFMMHIANTVNGEVFAVTATNSVGRMGTVTLIDFTDDEYFSDPAIAKQYIIDAGFNSISKNAYGDAPLIIGEITTTYAEFYSIVANLVLTTANVDVPLLGNVILTADAVTNNINGNLLNYSVIFSQITAYLTLTVLDINDARDLVASGAIDSNIAPLTVGIDEVSDDELTPLVVRPKPKPVPKPKPPPKGYKPRPVVKPKAVKKR